MEEKVYGGAGRRMRVADFVRNGQFDFLPAQWLADDAGKKSRCGSVGSARPDADGGKPDTHPVEKPAARVIGKEEFADGLLRTVAREWRQEEFVADRLRERGSKHCDRGRENDTWDITVADRPDGVEQMPGSIEVDADALYEIGFGLARHHGGKVENHVGAAGDELCSFLGAGEIRGQNLDGKRSMFRLRRPHDVVQDCTGNLAAADLPLRDQPVHELAADHPRSTKYQDFHWRRFLCVQGSLDIGLRVGNDLFATD